MEHIAERNGLSFTRGKNRRWRKVPGYDVITYGTLRLILIFQLAHEGFYSNVLKIQPAVIRNLHRGCQNIGRVKRRAK